jgi:hypothetical protein
MGDEAKELNPTATDSLTDDFATLIQFLRQTSQRISELIDGLSDLELRYKPSESEFSALENICHLRDLEVQGYTPRIRRMIEEAGPLLLDFDGARVAAESNYNGEQPERALGAFALARAENARVLNGLTFEQLEREGSLDGVGNITLRRLAELMREHDEGHLEDLRVLRQRLTRSEGS